jgi:hypothetical protein
MHFFLIKIQYKNYLKYFLCANHTKIKKTIKIMATHFCDKCMATASLNGDPSKVCDFPPHHFVPIVQAIQPGN